MGNPNNPDPYNSGQQYGGYDPNAQQYGAGQYGGYDPNAQQYGGQYDQYGQPASYPAQQYPGYPAAPHGDMQDPDNSMGIVGLVLAIACCGPVGGVVSWIALNKSKERGYKNTIALVGAILGGISTAMALIVIIFYVFIFAVAMSAPSKYLMGF